MARITDGNWIDPARSWTRAEAHDAIQRLIDGHGLCVPPQGDDADRILANVIDERDRLRAALSAIMRLYTDVPTRDAEETSALMYTVAKAMLNEEGDDV